MSTQPVNSTVKAVVSKILHLPMDQITDDSTSNTVDEWDSLGHMKIILALEEEFGLTFDDSQIADMTSISMISSIIEAKS
jgi:acyl carrier protein